MASMLRQLGILPEGKVILCPRRLVRKNGVINALLALDWVLRNRFRPDLYLVYAGEGHLRSEIEKMSQARGINRQVILLGSVKHSEINSLYSIADVVIVPSIRSAGVEEATSISALEAMASGVPVIVSDIGGLRELVRNEVNGLSVADGDYQELGAAILRILGDRKMREYLSREARKTVLHDHSHIHGAKQFLKVYKETLETKKPCSVR
jgi:glycogen(starch) synthase